jgi:hypothetical protein
MEGAMPPTMREIPRSQFRRIRTLVKYGMTVAQVAKVYGVATDEIARIVRLACGGGRRFALFVTDRRPRREYRQHTRFAGRLLGRRQRFRTCSRADRRGFRGEQGFGRFVRSADPLAIIGARVRLLLSARQDLLRMVDSSAIIETTIR